MTTFKYFISIAAFVGVTAVHADELVGAGGLSTDPASTSPNSSGESMSSTKIACLLQSEQVSPQQAQESAQSIEKAMQKLKLDTSKFTPTAMLHFLAQIKAESDAGGNLTQGGGPCGKSANSKKESSSSTGYGFIQLTGTDNLKKAQDCIKTQDPSSGNVDLVSNPEQTIGNCAQDKTLSAEASLCFWKISITDNGANHSFENKTDADAVEHITRVINGGGPDKSLSPEAQKSLPDRERNFEEMKMKVNTCGENLVS